MVFLNHRYEYSKSGAAFLPLLTAMNPEVFLQMVLVFEGLATLGAFELAVAGRLVEQLVLWERKREICVDKMHRGGESQVNNHNRSAWQQATSQTAPVANEASWLSAPTSVERLQAAAAITERITYLLISWLLSQRRHAFRIWQPRK